MEFPKIETLYERDAETFRVTDTLRLPEFSLITQWLVTEKIDGTNVRVFFEAGGEIRFGGRTDAAQMPTFLLAHLQETFTTERIATAVGSASALIAQLVEQRRRNAQVGGSIPSQGSNG